MPVTSKALMWAALIIPIAVVANGQGWEKDYSLVFIGGTAAIAVLHLYRGRRACAKEA